MTQTPSTTFTATPTVTPSNTSSFTATPSNTASNTATPSNTPSLTATPSNTSSVTATPSNTPSNTVSPTVTPSNTMSHSMEITPSSTKIYTEQHFAGLARMDRFGIEDIDYNDHQQMISFLGESDDIRINSSSAFYLKGNSLYAMGKRVLYRRNNESYSFNRTTASVEKIYDNVKLFDSTTYLNGGTEYENLYFVSSIDNKLYGVGGNHYGQLGHNHAHEGHDEPMLVETKDRKPLLNVVQISTFYGAAYFVTESGELWSIGNNSKGQLGLGDEDGTDPTLSRLDNTHRYLAEKVTDNVLSVEALFERMFFITRDKNLYGALGATIEINCFMIETM